MDSLEFRVIEGADAGMRVALGEGGFVGRSAACRFRLSDPSVQPMHAGIRKVGDRYVLTDVSEDAGLQVNDLPVKSRPLHAGDRIRVGAVVLEVLSLDQAAECGAANRAVAGSLPVEGTAEQTVGPAAAGAAPAPTVERRDAPKQSAARVPESGTPAWIVSGVIAAIVVVVVLGLWLHLMSLRKEVETRYHEVSDLAKSGRVTSSEALERYRGILKEAEEVHPQMAERLKAKIGSVESDMSAGRERVRVALRDLDTKADELAGRGEYAEAAEVYSNADSSLKKMVEELRTGRIAELERLAAGQAAKQGKTE